MDTSHILLGGAALILFATFIATGAVYNELPQEMVTHWDATGQPNDSMPREQAAFLLPILGLVFLVGAVLLPRIDPLRGNYAAFWERYAGFITVLIAFLGYVHGLMLAANLGFSFNMAQAIIPGISLLIYAVGSVFAKAERNWFIGIRTPWTMSSDTVWAETHRIGSTVFRIAAVIMLIGLVFPRYATVFIGAPVAAAALFTTLYSYYRYRREH